MLKTMRKNVKALKPTLWIIIATFVVAIFAIWGGAGRLGETNRTDTLVTIGKRADLLGRLLPDPATAARGHEEGIQPAQPGPHPAAQRPPAGPPADGRAGAAPPDRRGHEDSGPPTRRSGTGSFPTPSSRRTASSSASRNTSRLLDWNRIPLADFEASLKKEILIDKVVQLLTAGITVSDEEVWENYKKQNESAKIEYLVAETDKIEVDGQAGRRRDPGPLREEQGPRTRIPETRTADYVFFRTDDLKKDVKIDPTPRSKSTTGTTSPSSRSPERSRSAASSSPSRARTRPRSWPRPTDVPEAGRGGRGLRRTGQEVFQGRQGQGRRGLGTAGLD